MVRSAELDETKKDGKESFSLAVFLGISVAALRSWTKPKKMGKVKLKNIIENRVDG